MAKTQVEQKIVPVVVRLKNGSTEPEECVAAVLGILEKLLNDAPVTFCQFVMFCQNPDQKLYGQARKVLKTRHLLEPEHEDRVHRSIRNITLSAVTKHGIQITMTNPRA